jgi:hypothetical protein
MIRVVVADDHALVRDGLRLLMGNEPDLEIVGEAGDGEEAIGSGEAPARPRADGSHMPKGGVQAIEDQAREPEVRVLVLTMHDDQYTCAPCSPRGRLLREAGGARRAHRCHPYGDARPQLHRCEPRWWAQQIADPQPSPSGRVGAQAERPRARGAHGARARIHEQPDRQADGREREASRRTTRLSDKLGFRHRADLVRYALEAGLLGADQKA